VRQLLLIFRVRENEELVSGLELGRAPIALSIDAILDGLASDKKHRAGHLRWVLPTGAGHVVEPAVPDALVRSVTVELLAGTEASSATSTTAAPS